MTTVSRPSRSVPGLSRRGFLRTSAALAGAAALPAWFAEECAAATRPKAPSSPNDQPAIALIGCGGMGRGDGRHAAKFGRVVALCDVDSTHLAEALKDHPGAATYRDFRRVLERPDIDVVLCATPDHWHAEISAAAMKAGKDVHCQKPLTLTIEEGRRLRKIARSTKRILQTGSQQRSDAKFRLACELVRNGRIGKVRHVEVWLPAGLRGGPFASTPVPSELDWDFWQGPVAAKPYVKERCHLYFRYWYDYSGGTMTDWGAHHHDIVMWGLGMDGSGPTEIEAQPRATPVEGGYTAFSEYEVNYTYPNGVTQSTRSTRADSIYGGVVEPQGQHHGLKFIGSDGWIWVTRGDLQASDPTLVSTPLPAGAVRLYASADHKQNFFECVRSRQAPICDVEVGHRSASVCHLGVIALRLGRRLKWDPAKEQFVGDREANGYLARERRRAWDIGGV